MYNREVFKKYWRYLSIIKCCFKLFYKEGDKGDVGERGSMLWIVYPEKALSNGARTHENRLVFAKSWERDWQRCKQVCSISGNVK